MSAGSPPTLWWLLIVAATPSVAARLDHVGVERALDEPADVAEPSRLLLEDADELLADPLALRLGVADARRAWRGSAPAPRRGRAARRSGCRRSRRPARPRPAQEAVVDEDAGQLVADRLVDEQRGDGAVDAARERADHALAADLRADRARPAARSPPPASRTGAAPATSKRKFFSISMPCGRVHDLGVELDAVEAALGVLEGGDRRRLRAGGDASAPAGGCGRPSRGGSSRRSAPPAARRRARPRVALSAALPNSALPVRLDPAAELERHQLHAVADAEHRDAELEDRRVDLRRALGVDRGGAAREDQRDRIGGGGAPRRWRGARRAPSRRAPRARGGRSAARTGRRGRPRAPAARRSRRAPGPPLPSPGAGRPQPRR